MTRPLFAALVLFAGLTACTKTPTEAGTALGQAHVEAIQKDQLTYERFERDLEEALADYETEPERDAFTDAYSVWIGEATEPLPGQAAQIRQQWCQVGTAPNGGSQTFVVNLDNCD